MVVNSGREGQCPAHPDAGAANPGHIRHTERAERMVARIGHFRPRLAAVPRPVPLDGPAAEAWSAWLPLVDGAGLYHGDPRALVVRGEVDGRGDGTTSISLV